MTHAHKWQILIAMTILMVTLALDFTSVNLALVSISKSLHAQLSTAQWILSGFFIACAMLTGVAGKLGDIFGYKRLFLIGTGLFLIGSAIAGCAQGSISIILPRILQGIGTAICFPMIYAITLSVFPSEQKGIALGIITAGNGLAQALGPTFGGLLIHLLNWRWIFLINLPITAVSMLLFFIYYRTPNNVHSRTQQRIDVSGIILLCSSLGLFILALNQSHVWGITSNLFIICLISSLILGIAFVFLQLRTKNPILDLTLFKNKYFLIANLARSCYQYAFVVILFLIGFYLQTILNLDVTTASLYLLSFTLLFGLISPFSGMLIDKIGPRVPTIIAFLLMIFTCSFLIFAAEYKNQFILIIGLLAGGLASGLIVPSTAIGALAIIPPEKTGQASGLFYTNMFMMMNLAVASCGAITGYLSDHQLVNTIQQQHLQLKAAQIQQLKIIATGLHPSMPLTNYFTGNFSNLIDIARQSFTYSFIINIQICLVLVILGLILSFFMPRKIKK